jgi:hypothetical protein
VGMYRASEGPAKCFSTDPPVHLLNPRPTHPPPDFFSLTFFLYVFGRFSVREVQKHHKNMFTKSPCRKLFPIKSTEILMSVFPRIFFLSRFRVFLSDGSSKTLKKTFCKKIVSKSFYKKFDKRSKTDFFSQFVYHVFRRFKNTIQKISKK